MVSRPHSEQVVRVSARTRPPLARFALHCLQRLGSFLNCLSWKKSCSPAVNTNSAPQSMHVRTLIGELHGRLPQRQGTRLEIGHELESLPVPFPCLRSSFNNKGPGRNKFSGALQLSVRSERKTRYYFAP